MGEPSHVGNFHVAKGEIIVGECVRPPLMQFIFTFSFVFQFGSSL